MAAFWLLTLFPQIPFVAYLVLVQLYVGDFLPLDMPLCAVGLLFLVSATGAAGRLVSPHHNLPPHWVRQFLELHFSLAAIRTFIGRQTALFYRLCQEENLSKAAARELAHALAASSTLAATAAARAVEGAYGGDGAAGSGRRGSAASLPPAGPPPVVAVAATPARSGGGADPASAVTVGSVMAEGVRKLRTSVYQPAAAHAPAAGAGGDVDRAR
jgi:hypothetical protein